MQFRVSFLRGLFFFCKVVNIVLHSARALVLHLVGYVTIDIEGKHCGGMSEILLDRFHIIPVLKGQHRIGVTEIMDPALGDVDPRRNLLEVHPGDLRVNWSADGGGEDKGFLSLLGVLVPDPRILRLFFLILLFGLPISKGVDQKLR